MEQQKLFTKRNRIFLLAGAVLPLFIFYLQSIIRFGRIPNFQTLSVFLTNNLSILLGGFLSTLLLLYLLTKFQDKVIKAGLVVIYFIFYPIFILVMLFTGLIIPFFVFIPGIIIHFIPVMVYFVTVKLALK